jgi:transcriptional regulator with XRE-family HTH domain
MARTIGTSQSYLSRRTNGFTAFDVDDLGAIADEFGITITELINMPRDDWSPVSDSNRRPPLYIVDGSLEYDWPAEQPKRKAA